MLKNNPSIGELLRYAMEDLQEVFFELRIALKQVDDYIIMLLDSQEEVLELPGSNNS